MLASIWYWISGQDLQHVGVDCCLYKEMDLLRSAAYLLGTMREPLCLLKIDDYVF